MIPASAPTSLQAITATKVHRGVRGPHGSGPGCERGPHERMEHASEMLET